jgi:hypothetical protein
MQAFHFTKGMAEASSIRRRLMKAKTAGEIKEIAKCGFEISR